MTHGFTPSDATTDEAHVQTDPGRQWLDARLHIRAELRFDMRRNANENYVVIEDPVRCKFFQVGSDEYRFIASLNGSSTIQEIVEKIQATHPGSIDADLAITICKWLVTSNLVIGREMDNLSRLTQQAKAFSAQQMLGRLNPICFKLRLFNPNQVLKTIQPYANWFFTKSMFAIWILVALVALGVVFSQWDAIGNASIGILAKGRWIWLLCVWIALKVIHETGHGIACRKYGGDVSEAGILILLFTPLAFVNVTSSWRFPNRWHRIVVAAAGMYVELFVSFLAIIVWANREPGLVADVCFNIFIAASVSTVLFNANPLMRFDGYYILSDILAVPNLYSKGTRWFGDLIKRTMFGTPATPNICQKNERFPVAIYGSMAFFWKILISLSLIIGSSVIFHGAGIMLAVFGIGLWFGLPVFKQLNAMFGPNATQRANYKRVTFSGILLLLLLVALFTILRGPATKSAPAIVQFKDELLLRAGADGFVQNILIRNGQDIAKGDVLIKLHNPELDAELRQLQLRAEEAAIQTRIYQQTNETALAQAEKKNRESLLIQLAAKAEQIRGLTVVAPFDGFVFQRNLEHQQGVFVHQGDAVLSIAQRQTKEISASIDQADLESIKVNKNQLLRVVFPGSEIFRAKLIRVNPRADDKPIHPSLCANFGGPLAVRRVKDQSSRDELSVELLAPRFTADLVVSPELGNRLHSGQRGRVFFSAKQQSLGGFLYLAIADWFRNKLEKATLTATF